jgi:hypothetical protein
MFGIVRDSLKEMKRIEEEEKPGNEKKSEKNSQ